MKVIEKSLDVLKFDMKKQETKDSLECLYFDLSPKCDFNPLLETKYFELILQCAKLKVLFIDGNSSRNLLADD